ncbi:helix-turn-helix domain-containing protein [Cloacibacillus sp. An23]|uniref:winged helix-turn-helix transcriptional regulator n=1 Tax=Cloacibacillus sp. An23 TaxID=1965591 RepID=UPI000B388F45|nr:helix-turn-helix domain-containing protein [Cloacibacillus sp. An23]
MSCENGKNDAENGSRAAECPVVYALRIIGQKWRLPVMWHLYQRKSARYSELKRSINGVTNMMLTKALRELEARGLIERRQYEAVPPRVEYSLTARGASLIPTLDELYKWGEEQMRIDGAQRVDSPARPHI